MHVKCRGGLYPFSQITRLIVPDELVSWDKEWKDYNPPEHTSSTLKGKPWSDLDINDPNFVPKFNEVDGHVNRVSYLGKYTIDRNLPLNPMGRTGIQGRGVLGRWGPNHAADPIVTRWKRNTLGEKIVHTRTSLPILQFCAIQRRDNGEWAIPGGMVDPGEKITTTLLREFQEEAFSSINATDEQKRSMEVMVKNFFHKGAEIYRGYVDDPRNTDNAWMETVAWNFHDETGELVGKFPLKAGDDAVNVRWMDIDDKNRLYASHSDFLKFVCNKLLAHF